MTDKTDAIKLRLKRKKDYRAVEQITCRAFANAPPTGADDDGSKALLAQKLRTDPAFMSLPLQDGVLDGIPGRFYYAAIFDQLGKEEADTLNKKLASPMDIDEYIGSQTDETRPLLEKIRGVVRLFDPDGHIVEIDGVVRRFQGSGMAAEETAARMDVPGEYI